MRMLALALSLWSLIFVSSANADSDANKAMVTEFYEKVVAGGDIELADQFLTPGYIQHNPNVPTGRDAFKSYFAEIHDTYDIDLEILSVVGDGDMVVIHVEQTVHAAFFDISIVAMDRFRIEDGLIAEHWDVVNGKGAFDRFILSIAQ